MALAVKSIARSETGTVVVQRGSVPAAGQLLPAVVEVRVLASRWLPVSGLFTVTEKVMVAVSPGLRFPVQVRARLAYDTVPAVRCRCRW